MEGFSKCPQLLDLIPTGEEWFAKRVEEKQRRRGFPDEKKLELSLGPPGGEWVPAAEDRNHHESSVLSLGYFKNDPYLRGDVMRSPWREQSHAPSFLHLQTGAVIMEPSQACGNRAESQSAEKKAFSAADPAKNTASNAQKRSAPAPVVGWPPIRSFRKNIASGSSPKLPNESPDVGKAPRGSKPAENGRKGLFVKINMDGVPIGRKVDLKTNDSYEKLSYVVDELFRGLLEAQGESCAGGMKDKKNGGKEMGCLLDGSGEYTLVYEDNEGDRMLVGDVPWQMFVATVKRLRVLKTSELPTLSRGSQLGKLSQRA